MYNCKRPDLIYDNGIKDEPTDFAIFLIGSLLPFHTYRYWGFHTGMCNNHRPLIVWVMNVNPSDYLMAIVIPDEEIQEEDIRVGLVFKFIP